MNNNENQYPDLKVFSESVNIPESKLIEGYLLEKEFHSKILNETDYDKRSQLYSHIYNEVHKIYGKDKQKDFKESVNSKNWVVKFFRKELENKSVVDIGCGTGAFLFAIEESIPFKSLCGVDVSIPALPEEAKKTKINFLNKNIIKFDLNQSFDVAMLDNVYEHISPFDTASLLNSVSNILNPKGKIILWVPNRLFGPWDVTRIVDFSYSGKVEATGTHLNETTYQELLGELKKHGFGNFKSIIPFRGVMSKLYMLRISSTFLAWLESKTWFIKFLKMIRVRNQCFFHFPVIVIGTKLK